MYTAITGKEEASMVIGKIVHEAMKVYTAVVTNKAQCQLVCSFLLQNKYLKAIFVPGQVANIYKNPPSPRPSLVHSHRNHIETYPGLVTVPVILMANPCADKI